MTCCEIGRFLQLLFELMGDTAPPRCLDERGDEWCAFRFRTIGSVAEACDTNDAVAAGCSLSCGLCNVASDALPPVPGAPPPPPMPPGYFVEISSGEAHSCAVLGNGYGVRCWGSNSDGQAEPPDGIAYVAVSTGDRHTCAMRAGGRVDRFGRKFGEQPRFTPYTDIAAGGFHTCGVALEDGRAVCFRKSERRRPGHPPARGHLLRRRRRPPPLVRAGRRRRASSTTWCCSRARRSAGVPIAAARAARRGASPSRTLRRATTTRARSRKRRGTRAASGRMPTSRARRRQASPSRRSRQARVQLRPAGKRRPREMLGRQRLGPSGAARARTRGTLPSPPAGRTRAPCAPMAAPPCWG